MGNTMSLSIIETTENIKYIDLLLENIPTYKDKESLLKIQQEVINLPPKSKVLIIGAGQGAEIFAMNYVNPDLDIVAVDSWMLPTWDESFINKKYLPGNKIENTLDNFLSNCDRYMKKIPNYIRIDIRQFDLLPKDDWSFIYYDAMDNTDHSEDPTERDQIFNILNFLHDSLELGRTLMGDDYFIGTGKQMTTIVDRFAKLKKLKVESEINQNFWSVKKFNYDGS
jgi:hypothetical protein